MTDEEMKIVVLKAEIFDLQVMLGRVRADLEAKLKQLNDLQRAEVPSVGK